MAGELLRPLLLLLRTAVCCFRQVQGKCWASTDTYGRARALSLQRRLLLLLLLLLL